MEVERVQRWVMSSLMFVTAVIFASGLSILSGHSHQAGAKPGLLIIAAVVGVLAVAAVRLINKKPLLTLWLVVGLIPAGVGWYFVIVRN